MDLSAAIQCFTAMRANIQFCFQKNIQDHEDDRQRDIRCKYERDRCQCIQHQTEFLEFFKLRFQGTSFIG